MLVKETFALLGTVNEEALVLRLAQQHHPVVLVADYESQWDRLAGKIREGMPAAVIETIDCARDGCWEADIIVIQDAAVLSESLIEKIKEVSTQKIVICLFNEKVDKLQQALPYTKVISMLLVENPAQAIFSASPMDATETLIPIFEGLNYQIILPYTSSN